MIELIHGETLEEVGKNIHFKSNDQTWETPIDFFNELDKEFGFTLDPCCTKETAKCSKYFTEKEDGLIQDWSDEIVFMNPPYGREIKNWIKKAHDEFLRGATVVALIPSRTDTKYWHTYIFPLYYENKIQIRFLKGRLKFGNAVNSAPFPSALVIFKQI